MKILNKEVTTCLHCPCSHPFIHEEYTCRCNLTTKLIDTTKGIDEECPFLQPITKEVIESFGFKQSFRETYFELGDFQIYLNIHPTHNITIYGEHSEVVFEGTINNKIELEFILRSIGVI
jgi:hypothetical protein